jgi:AbrB family looped-hinge helix DNA binding protein
MGSEYLILGKADMAETTTVRQRGQVTIPAEIRRAAGLEEGDPVEVELVADGILLRPKKVIDAAQAWFWAPSWQAGERDASEQIDAGAGAVFADADAFLKSLES